MADELPLLRLGAPKQFGRKKRKPNFPPPPERDIARHARVLAEGADQVLDHFRDAQRRTPALATDVPYIRLVSAPGAVVTDQEIRQIGLVPVFRREASVLAAYAPDGDLQKFRSQVDSYRRRQAKLAILAKTELLAPWSREDRLGPRLREIKIEPGQIYTVDLVLLPPIEDAANVAGVRAIEKFVTASRGAVLDKVERPELTVMRVRMGGQSLDTRLDCRDDIAVAELPPKVHGLVPEILSFGIDDVPEVIAPEPTAPALCVVDSGILEGHPLLAPAMLSALSRSFLGSLGPPIPAPPVGPAGHGTRVAGRALYGDVERCVDARAFAPGFWIVNARFLDDRNELSPDRMPLLRPIVEHAGARCRVFNLSLGLEPCDGTLSIYATELDALAREFDTLFVVSAGNRDPEEHTPSPDRVPAYPDALENHAARVLAPAEALNVLTVGAITRSAMPYSAHRTAVAPARSPSPFSRSLGIAGVVKPEVVEEGGNLAIDATTRRWIRNDPALGIATTSHQYATQGQVLTFDTGTSIAAPKVAHMAVRLVGRLPDASANLLRALLVQSARLPDGTGAWDARRSMRLCGFGVPSFERASTSAPNRVTLFHEGTIAVDDVQIFEVPVPPDFARSKGRKSITVTIAYDPPVSFVHRDRPSGISLTWGLARGDKTEASIEAAITAQAAAEGEAAGVNAGQPKRKVRSLFMKGDLPKLPQRRGTVQKNVFAWERGSYGDTYRLAVTAKATRGKYADAEQSFAIVVTLETADAATPVFTMIRARLQAGRVRVNS